MNNKRWSSIWTEKPGRNSLKWKDLRKIQKLSWTYLLNPFLTTSSSSTSQVQHKWFSLTKPDLFKLEALESTIRGRSSNSKKSTMIQTTIQHLIFQWNKELQIRPKNQSRCRKVVSATLHATIKLITLSISLQDSRSKTEALPHQGTFRMTYGSYVLTQGCTNALSYRDLPVLREESTQQASS